MSHPVKHRRVVNHAERALFHLKALVDPDETGSVAIRYMDLVNAGFTRKSISGIIEGYDALVAWTEGRPKVASACKAGG